MLATIDDLRVYLNIGELNSQDILSIMTIMRVQLERDNRKKDFQWLNLFCDWCVHTKLSKSALSIDIFKTFYAALGDYDFTKGQSMKGFYNHIFDRLRQDIATLFIDHAIPAGLVEDEKAFCGFLIGILLIVKDRTISPPKRLSQFQETEVRSLPKLLKFAKDRNDIDWTPISLSITRTESGYFNFILTMVGQPGGTITFNLSTIGYRNKALQFIYE